MSIPNNIRESFNKLYKTVLIEFESRQTKLAQIEKNVAELLRKNEEFQAKQLTYQWWVNSTELIKLNRLITGIEGLLSNYTKEIFQECYQSLFKCQFLAVVSTFIRELQATGLVEPSISVINATLSTASSEEEYNEEESFQLLKEQIQTTILPEKKSEEAVFLKGRKATTSSIKEEERTIENDLESLEVDDLVSKNESQINRTITQSQPMNESKPSMTVGAGMSPLRQSKTLTVNYAPVASDAAPPASVSFAAPTPVQTPSPEPAPSAKESSLPPPPPSPAPAPSSMNRPSAPPPAMESRRQDSKAKHYKGESKKSAPKNSTPKSSAKDKISATPTESAEELGRTEPGENGITPRNINIGISYYDRVIPYSNFDLIVTLSHLLIKKEATHTDLLSGARKTQKREEVKFLEDTVEVVPVCPGCLVSPSSRRAKLDNPHQELKFVVTPLIKGEINSRIEFQNLNHQTIHSIDIPTISRSARTAKVIATVGTIAGVAPSAIDYVSGSNITDVLKDRVTYDYPNISNVIQGIDIVLVGQITIIALSLLVGLFLALRSRPKKAPEHAEVVS